MTTIHTDADSDSVREQIAQADDDIDPLPEGMVWRNRDSNQYHTDAACKRISDNKAMVREEIAESWDTWDECRVCSQEWNGGDEASGNACAICKNASARNVPRLGRYLCENCHPRPTAQSRDDRRTSDHD
jgi:hypothetical protein